MNSNFLCKQFDFVIYFQQKELVFNHFFVKVYNKVDELQFTPTKKLVFSFKSLVIQYFAYPMERTLLQECLKKLPFIFSSSLYLYNWTDTRLYHDHPLFRIVDFFLDFNLQSYNHVHSRQYTTIFFFPFFAQCHNAPGWLRSSFYDWGIAVN